jgi:uncharacterized protein (DUF302 family)
MPQQRPAIDTVAHEVHRLAVDVDAPFAEFRAQYEQAVPRFDARRFEELQREEASWDTVVQVTAENAPHGFITYWSSDVSPMMRLAGDRWQCVEYLMGNHTIAQKMFRYDPAVMLYAPLRTAIYEDHSGRVRFAVDQPSTRFASFGNPKITEVGEDLDRKLGALLEFLGVTVPPALAQ